MSDSSRRGVLESQGKSSWWVVRFADRSRSFRVADLELLPTDAAAFEPSQAPLNFMRKRASAKESLKRGLFVAASTNQCAECQISLMAGTLGPAFAS